MTETLKVTPTELETAATSFEETGKNVNNLTKEMLTLIENIATTVWSGEASDAYKKKFASLADDIDKVNAMISEHVADLRAIAAKYKSAEDKSKELANALKADIIS